MSEVNTGLTVLDVLDLIDRDDTYLVMDSPYFKYSYIGRATEGPDVLPKFVRHAWPHVTKVTKLSYNKNRANVSFQVIIEGDVHLPKNDHGIEKIESHLFRMISVIKGGELNINELPLIIHPDAYHLLLEVMNNDNMTFMGEHEKGIHVVLNLENIPIVNSVPLRFDNFCYLVRESFEVKGILKGITSSMPKAGAIKYKDTLAEASAWLSSIGVKDGGFNPKVDYVTPKELSTIIEMQYKVQGLSALPDNAKVSKKIDKGTGLTIAEYLVSSGMSKYDELVKTEELNKVIESLEAKEKHIDYMLRLMIYDIIINDRWFNDFHDKEAAGELDFYCGDYIQKITASIVKKEV